MGGAARARASLRTCRVALLMAAAFDWLSRDACNAVAFCLGWGSRERQRQRSGLLPPGKWGRLLVRVCDWWWCCSASMRACCVALPSARGATALYFQGYLHRVMQWSSASRRGFREAGVTQAAFCRQWGGLLMWRATAVDWLAGCLWRSDAATFCHQVGLLQRGPAQGKVCWTRHSSCSICPPVTVTVN